MMRNGIGDIALVNEVNYMLKGHMHSRNSLVPTICEFELGHGDVTLMHGNAPAH